MRSKTSLQEWIKTAYTGLHYDLHLGAKDRNVGAGASFKEILHEISKVAPDFIQYDCKGHPGYAGYPTRVGTPAPGLVRDALKVWKQVSEKLQIPLFLHYSGLMDRAAIGKHPEWAQVEADGKKAEYTVCLNSGYLSKLLIPQLIEIIDRYDIDGFWMDGENWAAKPCYCSVCRSLFKKQTGLGKIPKAANEPHWKEWLAFHRACFERYVRSYTDAVHRRKPDCLVCSNWLYSARQPEEIRIATDYLSGDLSPTFGCDAAILESRFLAGRDKPWNLMAWGFFSMGGSNEEWHYPAWTFKNAEYLKQEAVEVITQGGAFIMYDHPRRDGRLVGWRQDIMAEVAAFCRERQPWCQNTESLPQAVVLHNAQDHYAKNARHPLYALDPATPADKPLQGALYALLQNHYSVDLLNEHALQQRIRSYPLVILPEPTAIIPALKEALKEYVYGGGRLLISGVDGTRIFKDILDVRSEGPAHEAVYAVPVGGEMESIKGLWRKVKPAGRARILKSLFSGEDPGRDKLPYAAAIVSVYGKGRIVYIPGPIFEFFSQTHYPRIRAFIWQALEALRSPALISVKAPVQIEIAARRRENRILIHFINRSTGYPLSPRNAAVEDIPPYGPISVTVPLKTRPKSVCLAPGRNSVSWKWIRGKLMVKIPSIHIHQTLVVD